MEKVIIFGNGKTAELAHYYFTKDSNYQVVAFTVDSPYLTLSSFCGLPVYEFENIESTFSVEEVYFFAAIGTVEMNKVRERIIKVAKEKGYRLASYISSKATIFENVKIGEHCFILEDNTIQPFVEVGDNNILWSGNHIGHHSKIGHHNFISSHVVVSGNTTIGNNCFFGVNSTIIDYILIANESLVGAGTFITRDTEEKGIYKAKFTEKFIQTSVPKKELEIWMNNPNLSISKYEEKDAIAWDHFIDNSKNGTFLHKTGYFRYHSHRFIDCSLMIKKNNQVVALLPGNIENDSFYSHRGLTYGGLIILSETKAEDVITYFNMINRYLTTKNIKKVKYKAIPYIYSKVPAQEDEYALFRLGAKLISSGISSVIRLDEKVQYSSQRKKSIKRAKKNNLEIKIDQSYDDFWEILSTNLSKLHQVKPVHSLSEIKKLKASFKENIKLFSVYQDEECVAGVVMYITENVARAQYTASTDKGKKISAVDFLYDYLIHQMNFNQQYFDFGISVEDQGRYLNEGLINQKQGLGGRAVMFQEYEYDVNNFIHRPKGNHK